MAKAGDTYTITLRMAHLKWGEYRYTGSRDIIYGEGYIPIPKKYAIAFNILNNNGTNEAGILGTNLFKCKSKDGLFEGVLRAQGACRAGEQYAKQFAGNKNLKALGDWFFDIGADIGDKVRVTWTSPTDIIIEHMPK